MNKRIEELLDELRALRQEAPDDSGVAYQLSAVILSEQLALARMESLAEQTREIIRSNDRLTEAVSEIAGVLERMRTQMEARGQ